MYYNNSSIYSGQILVFMLKFLIKSIIYIIYKQSYKIVYSIIYIVFIREKYILKTKGVTLLGIFYVI